MLVGEGGVLVGEEGRGGDTRHCNRSLVKRGKQDNISREVER